MFTQHSLWWRQQEKAQDVRDKCVLPRLSARGLWDSLQDLQELWGRGSVEKERPQADPAGVKACRRLEERRPGPRVHGALQVS